MSHPVISRRPMVALALLVMTTVVVAVGVLVAYPGGSTAAVAYLSQAQAATRLKAAGITWWSSGNCSDRNNAECTSFEHIRSTTIDGVITLKQASMCPIVITGGTETGHGNGPGYTHWNGWKVDIARYACVSAYIRTGFANVGYISGWGQQFKAPSGNVYTDEGTHWDILYYTCGGCGPMPTPTPTRTPSPRPTPSASPTPSARPVPQDALRVPLDKEGEEPPAGAGPPSLPTADLSVRG